MFRDKTEIRPLYKQHKNLERELERFADQVSPESTDAAAGATSAAAPSAPEEPSNELNADIPALVSPTDSTGAGEKTHSQEGYAETPTVPTKDADSESQLDKNNSEGIAKGPAEKENATAASAIPAPSDLEGQLPTNTPSPSTEQDGDLQESGDSGDGEAKEGRTLKTSGDGGKSEAKSDKTLKGIGDEGQGGAQEGGDLEGNGDGGEGEAREDGALEGSGDGGEGEAKEEEIDGGGANETQRDVVSGNDGNETENPEGEAAKTDQPQQNEPSEQEHLIEVPGGSLEVPSTPLLSPAGDTEKIGVEGEEGDSEVAMESVIGEEGGDVPEGDDDGDKGRLEPCVEEETHEAWPGRASEDIPGSPASLAEGNKEDDDGNDDKPMSAQEARVKRMRARFLRMKNLIDDDAVGASSMMAASSTLLGGVDASLDMEENEGGITSPPGEPMVHSSCVLSELNGSTSRSLDVVEHAQAGVKETHNIPPRAYDINESALDQSRA